MSLNILRNSRIWLKRKHERASRFLGHIKEGSIHQGHSSDIAKIMVFNNRTLVECACSMIKGKNISNGFWAEAISTAAYLKNRSPTKNFREQNTF
jgi:hypothetical protein